MLSIKTDTSKTNLNSKELIKEYLGTVLRETKNFTSDRKVRNDALAVLDEMKADGKLEYINPEDIEAAQKKAQEQKSEHGIRSWLNYHNRGLIQDYVHNVADLLSDNTVPWEEKAIKSAKVLLGIGVASVATGCAAQAVFGAPDYDRMMGASSEKLLSNFLTSDQSLTPVVAGVTAAAMVTKLGVSVITKPKSEEEAKKFEEYVDIKHAQIALKQLKKILKSEQTASNKNDSLHNAVLHRKAFSR